HRVAVAELVRQFHLHRDTAPVFDGVFGHVPGVGGGAAGDHHYLVDAAQHGFADAHLIEQEVAVGVHPPAQRVGHGLGLVVDLLFHEGVEPTLDGGIGVPVHGEGFGADRVALGVGDGDVLGGDGDHLVLSHLHGLPGVG